MECINMVVLKDYPKYEIYEDGRVYSHFTNKFLNPETDKDDYKIIWLSGINGRKRFKLHRLIAMTFLSNPENLPQVNHIDGNKANNAVENLEWCDAKHNMQHAYKTGLNKFNEELRSHIIALGKSKAKAIQYINLYSGYTEIFNSLKEASEFLGLNYDSVRVMASRKKPYLGVHSFVYC